MATIDPKTNHPATIPIYVGTPSGCSQHKSMANAIRHLIGLLKSAYHFLRVYKLQTCLQIDSQSVELRVTSDCMVTSSLHNDRAYDERNCLTLPRDSIIVLSI